LGVDRPGTLFLLGTDELGRDLFSRVVYATRISMSVGLIGVAVSFTLGCVLGGISGYYGGNVDLVIQRIIEFLLSIPTIPLWMGLAAALPHSWSPIQVYFAITIILSFISWCYLARVVRGKLLELREEDFVMAAAIAGAGKGHIIFRHMLPSFASYLIVNLTLAIPYMILGETALSFLGLGIQAPAVSWGVLLRDAQNVETVALYPWLILPVLAVIIAVLCLNFLGDGLRDAADPYR
jgi:peptide/nickel transport system permease protein